jgi:hypothetical protein
MQHALCLSLAEAALFAVDLEGTHLLRGNNIFEKVDLSAQEVRCTLRPSARNVLLLQNEGDARAQIARTAPLAPWLESLGDVDACRRALEQVLREASIVITGVPDEEWRLPIEWVWTPPRDPRSVCVCVRMCVGSVLHGPAANVH